MMVYFMIVSDEFVSAVGTSDRRCDGEISAGKYNEILTLIQNKPSAPSGYTYKLRADTLEWELVELPPEPDPGEEDATAEDYENALLELGVHV